MAKVIKQSDKIGCAYTYRNYPCTVGNYSVCGEDTIGGSGVLEWCSSLEDAKDRLNRMSHYSQFKKLTIFFGQRDITTIAGKFWYYVWRKL